MMKKINSIRVALLFGALTLAIGLLANSVTAAAPGAVNLTVTAVGKKDTSPPLVTKDDVLLYLNKDRTQVADWKHGEKLYLAVLIDDSLESNIANQWGDLKAFLAAQPDNTYVLVAYSRNGGAEVAQDFTNDHAHAAKALRIPLGSDGAFGSPYLALLDLMKRWPASDDRRSILLISSGIDYFRGGFGIEDPDLDSTISRAQSRTSMFGASMPRTPVIEGADSFSLLGRNRISANSRMKLALNLSTSAPANPSPSSTISMSSPCISATNIS